MLGDVDLVKEDLRIASDFLWCLTHEDRRTQLAVAWYLFGWSIDIYIYVILSDLLSF